MVSLNLKIIDITSILENSADPEMPRILKMLKTDENYSPINKEILTVNRAVVDDLVLKCGP